MSFSPDHFRSPTNRIEWSGLAKVSASVPVNVPLLLDQWVDENPDTCFNYDAFCQWVEFVLDGEFWQTADILDIVDGEIDWDKFPITDEDLVRRTGRYSSGLPAVIPIPGQIDIFGQTH